MQKKLLIIIDYQVDFAAPGGVLSAGEAALAIEGVLEARVAAYLAEGHDVVFTMDTHLPETWPEHPEHDAFAPHCQKGTPGWQVYGSLAKHLGKKGVQTIEKNAYCPEFLHLENWVSGYEAIEIAGLVTNICVLHTAVGLYTAKVNSGSAVRLAVLDEGCASFDPQAHAFALRHMHDTLGM